MQFIKVGKIFFFGDTNENTKTTFVYCVIHREILLLKNTPSVLNKILE